MDDSYLNNNWLQLDLLGFTWQGIRKQFTMLLSCNCTLVASIVYWHEFEKKMLIPNAGWWVSTYDKEHNKTNIQKRIRDIVLIAHSIFSLFKPWRESNLSSPLHTPLTWYTKLLQSRAKNSLDFSESFTVQIIISIKTNITSSILTCVGFSE